MKTEELKISKKEEEPAKTETNTTVKNNNCKCCIMEWGMIIEFLLLLQLPFMDFILVTYFIAISGGWYIPISIALMLFNFIFPMRRLHYLNDDAFWIYLFNQYETPPSICHWNLYESLLNSLESFWKKCRSNDDDGCIVIILYIALRWSFYYIGALLLFPILMLCVTLACIKLILDGKRVREMSDDEWLVFAAFLQKKEDNMDKNSKKNTNSSEIAVNNNENNTIVLNAQITDEYKSQSVSLLDKNTGELITATKSEKKIDVGSNIEYEKMFFNEYMTILIYIELKILNFIIIFTHDIPVLIIAALNKGNGTVVWVSLYVTVKVLFLVYYVWRRKKFYSKDDVRFEAKQTQISIKREVFNTNTGKFEVTHEYKKTENVVDIVITGDDKKDENNVKNEDTNKKLEINNNVVETHIIEEKPKDNGVNNDINKSEEVGEIKDNVQIDTNNDILIVNKNNDKIQVDNDPDSKDEPNKE